MTEKLKATTEDIQRLVVMDWWEWARGMMVDFGGDLTSTASNAWRNDSGQWWAFPGTLKQAWSLDGAALPVVSDPSTAGCLMALYQQRYCEVYDGVTPGAAAEGLFAEHDINDYASLGDMVAVALLELGDGCV